MTDEVRTAHIEKLKADTNTQLLERYNWYINNYNPVDFDRCADYELVKAEIMRRMGTVQV